MSKPIGTFLALWGLVLDYVEDSKRRGAAAREVAALDPRDRERMLGDAGLSQREFGDIMRTPFASDDLLSRAISTLGADPDELRCRHGGWAWDMDRICMMCPARGRCRRDLATSDFVRRYRLYCPNAGSLAQIAASAGRPASGDHHGPPAATA